MSTSTAAIVLAAGAGSRFCDTRHKLASPLPAAANESADTVSGRSIRHAVESDIGPVFVVTGAVHLELPATVTECSNPLWADGQAISLQVGISAARRIAADAVVIGLADQPAVTPTAWRAVAAMASPIAVATYNGVRGNPVRLGAEVWHLLPTEGDQGARQLMRIRPDLVTEVPCTGSAADIDTVEDLRRWQNS